MGSRGDAQGNRNQEFEDGSNKGDGKGHAHILEDNLCHGLTVLEAGTQIKPAQGAQPVAVALEDAHKGVVTQAVHLVHRLHRLFVDVTGVLAHGDDLVLHKIHRHQTYEEINDERHAQQNDHSQGKSFNNIL